MNVNSFVRITDQYMNVNNMVNMTNETGLWVDNSSLPIETEEAPVVVIAVILMVLCWIILANALLLICLLVSRPEMINDVNIQVIALSVTDLIFGIAMIPGVLTYHIPRYFSYYNTCYIIVMCFFVAMYASVFQMFGLCICRVIAMQRRYVRQHYHRRIVPVMQVVLPWLTAIVIINTIFLVHRADHDIMYTCSLPTLFSDNYKSAIVWVCGIVVAIETATSILYVFMYLQLMIKNRRTCIQVPELKSSDVSKMTQDTSVKAAGSSRSKIVFEKQDNHASVKECTYTGCNIHVSNSSNISVSQNAFTQQPGCSGTNLNVPNLDSIHIPEPRFIKFESGKPEAGCSDLRLNIPTPNVTDKLANQNDQCADESPNESQSPNGRIKLQTEVCQLRRSTVARDKKEAVFPKRQGCNAEPASSVQTWQKGVLTTIGMLLVVMNVSQTPYIVVVFMEALNESILSRRLRFIMQIVNLFGFVLNPFIYAARIRPLRESVIRSWRKFRQICSHSRIAPARYSD